MNLIIVIFTGILLFLVFAFLKVLLKRYSDQSNWVRRAGMYFPYFEFGVWVVFYFWSIDRMFINKSYYSILLLSSVIILLILFSWFYFKNVLAGIVFKMQHRPKKGMLYTFGDFSGEVKEIKSAHLTLETTLGEELKVPYSHLFGPLYEASHQKSHDKNVVVLRVSKKEHKDAWIQKFRTIILSSPWCSFKKEPVIKLLSEDTDNYEFEISLSLLHPQYLGRIEKDLRREF